MRTNLGREYRSASKATAQAARLVSGTNCIPRMSVKHWKYFKPKYRGCRHPIIQDRRSLLPRAS
jgi:hypothetical protein